MISSQKKLVAHSASSLNGAKETAAKKAARKREEARVPIDSVDEIGTVDGDGAAGDVDSKHGSPQRAPVQARAPPYRMLRFADVIECTGLSRTTIWRRVRAGAFPAPISLGENSCGWPENLITEWIESRPVVRYAPGPKANAV